MPLTAKGTEIKNAMEKSYGSKKGEQVFYASRNAGKITGVDGEMCNMADRGKDILEKLDAACVKMDAMGCKK